MPVLVEPLEAALRHPAGGAVAEPARGAEAEPGPLAVAAGLSGASSSAPRSR